jgi:pimeloyl-ACP methyl ester carboxylesterase
VAGRAEQIDDREHGTGPAARAEQFVPPDWFAQAIAATPEAISVHRDGRSIRAYRWGDPGGRPVILVHGAGANAHWWDHIGPQLVSDGVQVAAMDLSGHGESGWVGEYSLSGWAADVLAVAGHLSPRPPLLIGHSAGGRVAWKAAELHGPDLVAVVSVDGPLPAPAPQPDFSASRHRLRRAHRIYRDRDEIIRRFRPTPDQQVVLPYVLDHIAQRSVRPHAEGWTWAHDVRIYHRRRTEEIVAGPLGCPLFLVIAEKGHNNAATAALVRPHVPQMSMLTIPDAGHHIMLDQPLALVSVLRLITDLATTSARPRSR